MSATTRARFGASIVAPALLKPLDVGPARVELEVREILDEQVKRIENLGGAVAQSQVVGTDGEEFGSVTDFYIDLSQKKVPYLEVASGGLLGTLGAERFKIPIGQVVDSDEERIVVDQSREAVEGSPIFDPEVRIIEDLER